MLESNKNLCVYLKRVPATEQWMEPTESLLSKHQHTETIKTKQPSAEGCTGEAELHLCRQGRKQVPRANHTVTLTVRALWAGLRAPA